MKKIKVFIILSLLAQGIVGQVLNTQNLVYKPTSTKDPFLFGYTPVKRLKVTLKVGFNSSSVSDIKDSKSVEDAFDSIDFSGVIKESYRIKYYITKNTKLVINAQVIGFNRFFDSSSNYSLGVIIKV